MGTDSDARRRTSRCTSRHSSAVWCAGSRTLRQCLTRRCYGPDRGLASRFSLRTKTVIFSSISCSVIPLALGLGKSSPVALKISIAKLVSLAPMR